MNQEKYEKALDLLLKQDSDGFRLALHMGGFNNTLTLKGIQDWLKAKAEDDWDITIFIEDLESNLDPKEPPQRYLVKNRTTLVVPVFRFGKPNVSEEEWIPVSEINRAVNRVVLLGGYLASLMNNTLCNGIEQHFSDKDNTINKLSQLNLFDYPFSPEVSALIDLLHDDVVDNEGVTFPSLFKQHLSKLTAGKFYYCHPQIHDNGDLSLVCTVEHI